MLLLHLGLTIFVTVAVLLVVFQIIIPTLRKEALFPMFSRVKVDEEYVKANEKYEQSKIRQETKKLKGKIKP